MSKDLQDGRWGLVREGFLEEVVVRLVLKQNCEGKTLQREGGSEVRTTRGCQGGRPNQLGWGGGVCRRT